MTTNESIYQVQYNKRYMNHVITNAHNKHVYPYVRKQGFPHKLSTPVFVDPRKLIIFEVTETRVAVEAHISSHLPSDGPPINPKMSYS